MILRVMINCGKFIPFGFKIRLKDKVGKIWEKRSPEKAIILSMKMDWKWMKSFLTENEIRFDFMV